MQESKQAFALQNISTYRSEIYGFAILWIMLFHNRAVYPQWLDYFLDLGNMGCELFLFVSGVSLYYAVQKKPTLLQFFERRVLRLLVPLWMISIWEWLVLLFSGQIRFLQLVSRMTLANFWLTGNQQAWFLAFILVAYLLFPYIYSFLYDGRGPLVWRTAFLVFLAVGFTLLIYHLAPAYYALVEIALPRFPIFIVGCAFGKAVYEGKTVEKHPRLLALLLLLVAVVCGAIIELNILQGIYYRYMFALPGAALVLLLSRLFGRTAGSRFNRFFRFFGNMSIELYLIHLLGRRLLPETGFYNQASHLHYLLMLCASVLLAWAVSRLDNLVIAQASKRIP